jgi:hypothetical protein
VLECLPSKHETLSITPSTTREREGESERGRDYQRERETERLTLSVCAHYKSNDSQQN